MIRICDYDHEWPRLFEIEAARIRGALGALVLGLGEASISTGPRLPQQRIDVRHTGSR